MTSGTASVTRAAYGPPVRAAVLGIVVLAAAVVACSSPDRPDDPLGPSDPGTVPPLHGADHRSGRTRRASRRRRAGDGDRGRGRRHPGGAPGRRSRGAPAPGRDQHARRTGSAWRTRRPVVWRSWSETVGCGWSATSATGTSTDASCATSWSAGVRWARSWSRRAWRSPGPYPPDTGQQAALDAAQARAQAAAIGLWAPDSCGPAAPRRHRGGPGAHGSSGGRVPDAQRGVGRGGQHRRPARRSHRLGCPGRVGLTPLRVPRRLPPGPRRRRPAPHRLRSRTPPPSCTGACRDPRCGTTTATPSSSPIRAATSPPSGPV